MAHPITGPFTVHPPTTRPANLSLSLRARGDSRTALAFSRLVRASEPEIGPFVLHEGRDFSPPTTRRACRTFPSPLPLTSPSQLDSVIKQRFSNSSGEAPSGSISDACSADDARFLEGRIGDMARGGLGVGSELLSSQPEVSGRSRHSLTVLLGDSSETVGRPSPSRASSGSCREIFSPEEFCAVCGGSGDGEESPASAPLVSRLKRKLLKKIHYVSRPYSMAIRLVRSQIFNGE